MASLGLPVKKIVSPGSQVDELTKLLTQILVNSEGDQEMQQQTVANIPASTNTTGMAVIEPPQDQSDQEWIPQMIHVFDNNDVDPADRVSFHFIDVLIARPIRFFDMKGSVGVNTSYPFDAWLWPLNIQPPVSTTSDHCAEYQPFRLFRKVNGESWRRIRIDSITTATVGNRSFIVTVVYRRRPSTRV